jgi:hypothetical protein
MNHTETTDNAGRRIIDLTTTCGRGWAVVRETGRGFSAVYGYHVGSDYSGQTRTISGAEKHFKSEAGAVKYATAGAKASA